MPYSILNITLRPLASPVGDRPEKAAGQRGWLYKQPGGTKSSVEQIIVLCPVSYHSLEYFPKFLLYCQENDDSFIIDSFPLEK